MISPVEPPTEQRDKRWRIYLVHPYGLLDYMPENRLKVCRSPTLPEYVAVPAKRAAVDALHSPEGKPHFEPSPGLVGEVVEGHVHYRVCKVFERKRLAFAYCVLEDGSDLYDTIWKDQ